MKLFISLTKQLSRKIVNKLFFFFASLFTSLILSSCATLTDDIVVSSHPNSEINVYSYKTFAWNEDCQIAFDPIGQWEQPTHDTDDEVRDIIKDDLLKRGFSLATKEPDLLVTFSAGVNSDLLKLSSKTSNENSAPTDVPRSALAIALTDAKSGQTIWLAHANASAQEQQSIENIRKRIHYAVKQIFKTL